MLVCLSFFFLNKLPWRQSERKETEQETKKVFCVSPASVINCRFKSCLVSEEENHHLCWAKNGQWITHHDIIHHSLTHRGYDIMRIRQQLVGVFPWHIIDYSIISLFIINKAKWSHFPLFKIFCLHQDQTSKTEPQLLNVEMKTKCHVHQSVVLI